MKILTVAIPVYNTEKYIKRCLDSILLNEVLEDIEVIAVNDGSKDNSLKILKEYEKMYLGTMKVIDKENAGHGSTINAALNIATGKYFKVLDSDDWFDSYNFVDFVKKLKNSNEDVVVSPYTEEYTYTGECKLVDYSNIELNKTIKFDEIDDDDIQEYYFPMAAATYRLSLLKECNLSLFEKTFYVDMQYNITPIPYIKTIKYLDKPLYRYFIGRSNQSMSQENLKKNYSHHRKVLSYVIEYYTNRSSEVSNAQREYMKFLASTMITTFFYIVCVQIKDKKLSYMTYKKFDNYLLNTNKNLFEYVNKYEEIRQSRKLKYLNVRYFMRLYNVAVRVIGKLRSK